MNADEKRENIEELSVQLTTPNAVTSELRGFPIHSDEQSESKANGMFGCINVTLLTVATASISQLDS